MLRGTIRGVLARRFPLLVPPLLAACGANDRSAGHEGVSALQVKEAPLPLVLSPPDGAGAQRGRAAGAPAVQLAIVPRSTNDTDADARLCAVMAGASQWSVALPFPWPVDSVAPRLLRRVVRRGDVEGLRFVVPGVRAQYVFEGFTRDGSRRVSLRWPVSSDPASPVPVGAPDSVIEAALRPHPALLDSTVGALRFAPSVESGWPTKPTDTAPLVSQAVTDDPPLPVHRMELRHACPQATYLLPMLARADHTVRVPVDSGDRLTAHATVPNGTLRLQFDEAPPAGVPVPAQSTARTDIEATSTGVLTLRVQLQVLPKVQAARQTVYLSVQRSRPASRP
ncbi:MAG: hypothetical protein ACK6DR_00140 [Gemmatimonas sp.]|jgi:hypothetical protein|uniref:hypothetical protein n=1 Tax=Gemmatimonas sp. TaxID=1962908 RepID=UPI0022C49992|nr:hypothetical protein [Gemmatimonas sp.]MCE2953255.1 hypothetical protein [Gemmatimonas sp.]MCZ8012541.1 hypothetical protein [Gemmatimonas sp.]MCZ8268822.1 hypothetical protein [Gemmatimonas sp.]